MRYPQPPPALLHVTLCATEIKQALGCSSDRLRVQTDSDLRDNTTPAKCPLLHQLRMHGMPPARSCSRTRQSSSTKIVYEPSPALLTAGRRSAEHNKHSFTARAQTGPARVITNRPASTRAGHIGKLPGSADAQTGPHGKALELPVSLAAHALRRPPPRPQTAAPRMPASSPSDPPAQPCQPSL